MEQKARTVALLLLFQFLAHVLPAGTAAAPGWVTSARKSCPDSLRCRAAEVLVLADERQVTVDERGPTRIHVRRAVEVLRASGADAVQFREYVSPDRRIEDVHIWVVEGSRTKALDRASLFEVAGPADDATILTSSITHIKPGTIVVSEYDVLATEWGRYSYIFELPYQDPAWLVRLSVNTPADWTIQCASQGVGGLRRIGPEKQDWTIDGLPYRPSEPAMPDWRYFPRRIVVNCSNATAAAAWQFRDWSAVAGWFGSLADSLIASDTPLPDRAAARGSTIDPAKLETPDSYLVARDYIRYLGLEAGRHRWVPRSPAITMRNRYGDCKDKAILACALLRRRGIYAVPALVAVMDEPVTELPCPFLFDHCIVAVHDTAGVLGDYEVAGGKWLFFDPTDREGELGRLSPVLGGRPVLVCARSIDSPGRLPACDPSSFAVRLNTEITLDEKGRATGSLRAAVALASFRDSTLAQRWPVLPKQIEIWTRLLAGCVEHPAVSRFHSARGRDSLITEFDFTGKARVVRDGEITLFRPYPLALDTAAAPECPRQFPVVVGSPGLLEIDARWRFPAGWRVARVPDSVSVDRTGNTFAFHIQQRSGDAGVDARYRQFISANWLEQGNCDQACDFMANRRICLEAAVELSGGAQ